MAYEYTLLSPIDFSTRDPASDAQATSVERLKNAAYDDSARGTLSFFLFYRPIIEQYVSEFARLNPFFPEEKESDLFWLTMRHAFALLRSYEHKGYGSFRNLLRQLVNYNALNTTDKMAYMEEMSQVDRELKQAEFERLAILSLVLKRQPETLATSKILRNFLFYPERMAKLPEADYPELGALLDEFETEMDDLSHQYVDDKLKLGEIEALALHLAPLLSLERLSELVRGGAQSDLAASFFGRIRENPVWFGLPAKIFEEDGGADAGMAAVSQS